MLIAPLDASQKKTAKYSFTRRLTTFTHPIAPLLPAHWHIACGLVRRDRRGTLPLAAESGLRTGADQLRFRNLPSRTPLPSSDERITRLVSLHQTSRAP